MSRPISKDKPQLLWTEIDLGALTGNLRAVRKIFRSPSVGVLAVVKADAYGHGMARVSQALWRQGVRFFGVANIEEALALRRVVPRARILALGSFHPWQLRGCISSAITPTISSLEDARILDRALKGKDPFPVHVKIDTGMGRLGLPHRQTETFFQELKKLRHLWLEGVYTHFSSADGESGAPTHEQLRLFRACLRKIRSAGFSPRYVHAANSMGILRFREAYFNLVRPGLILYGLKPSPRAKLPPGIRPVLAWKTKISFLKKFSAGQTVSYGRTHRVSKNTLIATLPVGYSHGYRVAFSGRSRVLIGDRACRVAGRVTMDQTLVDVGSVPAVKRWEEAVLIGRQGKAAVSAEDLAALAHTIPYEIVCGIHSRVPRIYKN